MFKKGRYRHLYMKRICIVTVAVLILFVCIKRDYGVLMNSDEEVKSYSVSTSNDLATAVGMSVLESGGNAVDASVAISYVLGVVEPYASGIGGSGSMLIYDRSEKTIDSYNYGAMSGSSQVSKDNIAIPGMVKGVEQAHEKYGKLPMSDLIQPAIDYAKNGFRINEVLKRRIDSVCKYIKNCDIFYNEKGELLQEGEWLYQKELAETLTKIQQEGSSAFYEGTIAEAIVEYTDLSLEDLASYEVINGNVVCGTYRGYTLYSVGAPMSGTTLIQMLKMEEALDLEKWQEDINSYALKLDCITRAAYMSRYKTIGDPKKYNVDENVLVNDEHIKQLLNDIERIPYKEDDESVDTTSFSVVDSDGLIVTATNTISDFWGSKVWIDGIFMNNSITNFSDGINVYEPNKRSRTFTAPTIVVGENDYVLAIGTSGGNNIPKFLFDVLVGILKYNLSPQEAVSKPRVVSRHNTLYVETDEKKEIQLYLDELKQDYIWMGKDSWWGCVSLAGYSEEQGAFATYDFRRGATTSGEKNECIVK